MAVHVQTMGILSVDMPAQASVDLGPAERISLRSLIFEHLAAHHDANLGDALLDAQERLKPGYAILVDGRNAMQLGGLDLQVDDGSTVLITALVSGG